MNEYRAVHRWMQSYFGKASLCENPECEGKSKRFEWARVKGKMYAKDRSHFWQLCKSCHVLYDLTPEQRKAQSAAIRSSPKWREAIRTRCLPIGVSGIRGVGWSSKDRKWIVAKKYRGTRVYIGFFDDPIVAGFAFVFASRLFPLYR